MFTICFPASSLINTPASRGRRLKEFLLIITVDWRLINDPTSLEASPAASKDLRDWSQFKSLIWRIITWPFLNAPQSNHRGQIRVTKVSLSRAPRPSKNRNVKVFSSLSLRAFSFENRIELIMVQRITLWGFIGRNMMLISVLPM